LLRAIWCDFVDRFFARPSSFAGMRIEIMKLRFRVGGTPSKLMRLI